MLSHVPHLLFGVIGVVLFLIFAGLAQAKAQLPLTLLLICITVVPVVTLTVSQYAGLFPSILVRAMALASDVHLDRPMPSGRCRRPRPPIRPPRPEAPVAAARSATAIVLPADVRLSLFGLTDAIPVLLTTALIVAKMEEEAARPAAGPSCSATSSAASSQSLLIICWRSRPRSRAGPDHLHHRHLFRHEIVKGGVARRQCAARL